MALFRITWTGTFNNGEQWSTGHWVKTTTDEDAFDLVTDVADAYNLSAFDLSKWLAGGDSVEKMTAYKYDSPQGKALDQAEITLGHPGEFNGTSILPSQLACVVTLRTGAPGASRRGRMYLPVRAPEVLDTEGLLVGTRAQTLVTQIAGYMGAVNVAGLRHCVVVSRTTGEVRNIRSLEIGNVIDTQTRRRASIVESRKSDNVSQV